MPRASHTETVDASVATLWRVLVERIEDPWPYVAGLRSVEILERAGDYTLRRMVTETAELTERIERDDDRLEVRYALVGHPRYRGQVVNRIEPGAAGAPNRLTFAIEWRPYGPGDGDGHPLENLLREMARQVKIAAEDAERARSA